MYPVRNLVLISLLASGLLLSCVYSINPDALPSDPEHFWLSREQLASRYPETTKSDRFIFKTLLTEDLVRIWGEPDLVNREWAYYPGVLAVNAVLVGTNPIVLGTVTSFVLFTNPIPPNKDVWLKGRYCIEARIGTGFPDYHSRVLKLRWTELGSGDKPSVACMEVIRKREQKELQTSLMPALTDY